MHSNWSSCKLQQLLRIHTRKTLNKEKKKSRKKKKHHCSPQLTVGMMQLQEEPGCPQALNSVLTTEKGEQRKQSCSRHSWSTAWPTSSGRPPLQKGAALHAGAAPGSGCLSREPQQQPQPTAMGHRQRREVLRAQTANEIPALPPPRN